MKKILSDHLKRILNGLAQQDAGEFLSMHEKMKVLGMGAESPSKPHSRPQNIVQEPAIQHIAFISDGRGIGAPLDYVIDSCSRQGSKIDLLIHGTTDMANISALENRIRAAGIQHRSIELGTKPVDDIADYIFNQPSLIFLVAMPDDTAAKVLIEEVIPRYGRRIPVPLVLIEDRSGSHQTKLSAA